MSHRRTLFLAALSISFGTFTIGCKSNACKRPVASSSAEASNFAVKCGEVDYEVRCLRMADETSYTCACWSGGKKGKSFDRADPIPGTTQNELAEKSMDDALKVMNAGCGWKLE